MSGPIYDTNHTAMSKRDSHAFRIDIRDYWASHMRVIRSLGNNYNMKPAVVTYQTEDFILNWTRKRVDGLVLTTKKYSTQITTRIFGLTYFNNIYNASYYFITRVDIIYLPRTVNAMSTIKIGTNVIALNTFLGDYTNDVFFAFKQEHISMFIFCTSQPRKYSTYSGLPPRDSHELNLCMNVDTIFGKEKITVRTQNSMYKLPGFTRNPRFIYYITDIFTSLFSWGV